jgi:1-acyl-sn-glycerol-3-phosphate acyltransferase
MQTSLFGPPIVNKFLKLLGMNYLSLFGWKAIGEVPKIPKFVIILAPHTSNWDLIFILAVMYALGVKPFWFGKKEIFWWPVGSFFRWLGGIPVDRGMRKNMVQHTVDVIQTQERFILGISPEGTRSNTKYWKTGFYHIAHKSQIPIVFGFLDYKHKVGGFGPTLIPTGDIEDDMRVIRQFYSGITGKHPYNYGNIAIKPRSNNRNFN